MLHYLRSESFEGSPCSTVSLMAQRLPLRGWRQSIAELTSPLLPSSSYSLSLSDAKSPRSFVIQSRNNGCLSVMSIHLNKNCKKYHFIISGTILTLKRLCGVWWASSLSLKRFLLQHISNWHFGQIVIAKQLEGPPDSLLGQKKGATGHKLAILRHLYPCFCPETKNHVYKSRYQIWWGALTGDISESSKFCIQEIPAIHSKSEKVSGVCFSVTKKLRKKCINLDIKILRQKCVNH